MPPRMIEKRPEPNKDADVSPPATSAMTYFNSSAFGDHVNQLINAWNVPALAVAIVQNDTVASRGFGNATLDPPISCTADTLFDIASASKSLTAASVGLLVDDNEKYEQIQWKSKMSSLLPEDFVMAEKSYTDDVTVEDILSHRTGLPGHDNSYLSSRSATPDTPKSITQNLRNLPLTQPIRTRYMYCNLMMTVATHLVETYSKSTFEEFLHKNFFNPLKMTSTNLQPDAAIKAGLKDRMSTPYSWNDDSQTFTPLAYDQTPEAQGAGSIITSANDYIKWVRELMNHSSGKVISPELYEGLIRPRIIESAGSTDDGLEPLTSFISYAAGLETFHYRGHRVVKHDGLIGGFGTVHFFLPGIKFGGVVFGNSGESSGTVAAILMRELIDEALEIPKDQRIDWNAWKAKEEAEYEENHEKELIEMREELCPERPEPEPQTSPLDLYTGKYHNAGYHTLEVQIKEDKLFVDATDRTMGFTLSFEHVCDQTKYVAHLADWADPGDTDELKAVFEFEGEKVVKMGLHLEPEMEGLIWFDRV